MFKVFRNQFIWLGVIVLLGLLVRLYKIDTPLADWHSWRQADTAAVARNFYKEGFNLLIPKYDDMVPVSNNTPNINRYRMVEFPIYNTLVYILYVLNHSVDIKLARLVSIFMSLGSTIFLYLIVKKHWGGLTAFFSAVIFTFLPFNIYFSRVTLPEPSLVFFSLGMFFFTDLWIKKAGAKLFITSTFFAICALLIKPTALFYLLPLLYSFYLKEKRLWPIPGRYFAWLGLVLTPLACWRIWISQFPEGIPPSGWLLDGDKIRFKPAFWKWILGDRLGREILSVAGTILLFIGILIKPLIREGKLLHVLGLSAILYLLIFATGNVRHDYYQILIIPVLSMFTARGFVLLLQGSDNLISRIWTIPLAILLFFLIFYLGWGEVKGLYQINNGAIVEAGQFVDQNLPQNAVVIAPYNGDSAFLYQTNRPGLSKVPIPIEKVIEVYGANYYVSVNYDNETNYVMKKYQVVAKNPTFMVADLTKINPAYNFEKDLDPIK